MSTSVDVFSHTSSSHHHQRSLPSIQLVNRKNTYPALLIHQQLRQSRDSLNWPAPDTKPQMPTVLSKLAISSSLSMAFRGPNSMPKAEKNSYKQMMLSHRGLNSMSSKNIMNANTTMNANMGLNEVQKAEMTVIVHNEIEKLRADLTEPRCAHKKEKTQKSEKLSEPAPPAFVDTPIFDTGKANNWNSADVGYFLPDSTRTEHMRMVQNSMYFSNVLAFVAQIRALLAFKNEDIIRLNLSSCLRGEALEWFMSELTHYEREELRSRSLENGWIQGLMYRFRPRSSHALRALKKSKYNWGDVRSQHSLVMWAHNMLRLAKESNEFPEEWQQLHAVWDQIEIPLRGNVNEPTVLTSTASFMEELDAWYNLWC